MLTFALVWFDKNERKTREFCFSLQACVIFHHLLMHMGDAYSRFGLVWFGLVKTRKNSRILLFIAGMCDIPPPVDVHG
jgi:hypothetical protein